MKSVLLVKKCAITAVILFLVFPAGQNLLAGGGAENVVVVVNEDSWASMTVANEFIFLRKIPSINVIYLSPEGRWLSLIHISEPTRPY